jgi:hypothetical protein
MEIGELATRIRSGGYSVPAEKVAEAIIALINPTILSVARPEQQSPALPESSAQP